MLDIKQWRINATIIADKLKTRGVKFDVNQFLTLEKQRKDIQIKAQELQNIRNEKSKEIGQLKRNKQNVNHILAEVENLSDELSQTKQALDIILEKINQLLLFTPNLPHHSVPIGNNEKDNIEVMRYGKPPVFNFEPKDHATLGEALGLLDFQTATKISGARFSLMRGQLAKLHRALIAFMLDTHTQNGYVETYVPYLVNKQSFMALVNCLSLKLICLKHSYTVNKIIKHFI